MFRRSDIEQVFHVLCLLNKRVADFSELTRDWVDAIHCPYWPNEAEEWKNRQRSNGWPSDEVIENIVSGGCQFIIKPHQSNPDDDFEWRFSFSRAELILAHSWSDVQMFIFHMLRLIKSDVVKNCGGKDNTHLKTYHFKTLMFWACEEKSSEFWNQTCIQDSLREMLCNMIVTLIEKKCWNYFIRNNNMFDHLTKEFDFTNEVQYLINAVDDIDTLIDGSVSGSRKLFNRSNRKICITSPNKLFLTIILSISQIYNKKPGHSESVPYRHRQPVEKTVLLQAELIDIYNALVIHRRLGCGEYQELQVQEAKEYFKRARKHQDTGSTTFEISLLDDGHDLFERILATPLESNDYENCGFENMTKEDDSKEEIACQKNPLDLKKCASNASSITCSDKVGEILDLIQVVVYECLAFYFFKTISDHIDQPSYFLCAAYEANFHYTALKDFRKAAELCQAAIKHQNAIVKGAFGRMLPIAGDIFPLLITNRWSPIYDEYIQILIGFLTLGINTNVHKRKPKLLENVGISTRKPEHILFQIDPYYFILYLNIQCAIILKTASDAEQMTIYHITKLREKEIPFKLFLFTAVKINLKRHPHAFVRHY